MLLGISSLAYFSGIVSWGYDQVKINRFEEGGGPSSLDFSVLPASAPGGRHWAELGTEHFFRDAEAMQKKEAPAFLKETPLEIEKRKLNEFRSRRYRSIAPGVIINTQTMETVIIKAMP